MGKNRDREILLHGGKVVSDPDQVSDAQVVEEAFESYRKRGQLPPCLAQVIDRLESMGAKGDAPDAPDAPDVPDELEADGEGAKDDGAEERHGAGEDDGEATAGAKRCGK